MKILLTGGSGRVATEVRVYADRPEYGLVFTDCAPGQCENLPFECIYLDITDRQKVMETVNLHRPDAVIHLAAFTDVDGCEDDPETAVKVNVEGTHNISEASERVGARLIYMSTDYVFDGTSGPYDEEDEPSPVNHYGTTKLEAEHVVRKIMDDYVILRINVPYGLKRDNVQHNFVSWILEQLRSGKNIRIVSDQFINPTPLWTLPGIFFKLADSNHQGVLHYGGTEVLSRLEIARMTAEEFGCDTGLIDEVSTSEIGFRAARPLKSGLKTDLIERMLDIVPVAFRNGLSWMKREGA